MANSLTNAKTGKKDEFYTQLPDIEKELKHYKSYLKNKVVFCNCDDPYESNFFKYFAMNFNVLGLKKLIATSYSGSPFAGKELKKFYSEEDKETAIQNKKAYKVIMTELKDVNNDGRVDLFDVEQIIKHRIRYLKGDGDFRSKESIDLLKQADVVVTNPPFSLFREYIAQLIEYDKKFIVIGNQNAITYKEIFPLIRENKLWLGASIHSGDREFQVPDSYPLKASGCRVDEKGRKYIRVKGVRWWTNIEYESRYETLELTKNYSPEEYPKYDNYDAIDVTKTIDIPKDYKGLIGVPITFLDKYNPEQFELVGFPSAPSNEGSLNLNNDYSSYIGYKQDGTKTGRTGSTFGACPVFERNDKKNIYYTNGSRTVQAGSCLRLFIRLKHPS